MKLKKNKFPFYKQFDRTDCGPACLRMLAKYYGKVYSSEYLRELCNITSEGVSVLGITDAAEKIGFKTLVATVDYKTLEEQAPLPCIVHWRQRHFVIVYRIEKEKIFVVDPDYGHIEYKKEKFIHAWQNTRYLNNSDEGLVILFEPSSEFDELGEDKKKKKGFKSLVPYISSYKKYAFQVIVGLTIASIIQLILPFLTQSIVDKGINYREINFVVLVLVAQIMLFFSQSFVSFIQSWLLLYIGSRINLKIATEFLIKLMKLPVTYFDSKIQGDILQRLQDSDRLETFLTSSPITLFSVFNMLIFMGILMYYNTKIFIIFLLGAVLYIIWILFFMKKRAELDYRRFDESSGNSSSLLQIINGIREIKINGSEKRRRWGWEEMRIRLYKISIESLRLTQMQLIGANTINEIKNILISFVAAYSVIKGDMTLGMMLAVQYIIGQLNSPLISLVQFFREAQDAKISLERLNEVKEIEDEYQSQELNNDIPNNHNIEIQNLSFRYGGEKSKLILDNINLKVPQGKITAIVGESGSGKTTLIKLLLKLYKPSSGKIKTGDVDLNNIDTRTWRNACGVVMQDGYIFTDTIARNITESQSEGIVNKERLLNSVRIANIEEMIEGFPTGYNTRIGPAGTSGINLSGGQIQRTLIARAVYKNPEFLFFDEATSALDANNEKIIMENLNNFFVGKTVIVIAHRLSTVKNADNIIVLSKGKIIEKGTHIELIKAQGAYYELVKNQLELSN
ncbi:MULTISPECIES: peptidase domain-containing ABC transporter [Elizabethkingia]|uniref:peptidase domain-containing ABC transporter n=1 Tax=Elizabethkingia TaxID=308865 RepID=UPI001902F04D|nr:MULTISPECIES: peptidase domain-containing ABC transporter [Elizabethkingia]QQM28200.1 peptidase domain-containing ABC transporter [Elizabethkingia sp. M8]CAH1145324.1 Alpha-hemolysin translocation ATP-binding protein HlyB [Elizabethkingia anophelis]CAI9679615.1 Alpha-hemolysin translocation ATP-binding protein HlyB [Elizabethkingia anophelis]